VVGMLMLLVHAVEIVIKVHKVLGSRLQILSSGFEGKSTSDRDYNFFFSFLCSRLRATLSNVDVLTKRCLLF